MCQHDSGFTSAQAFSHPLGLSHPIRIASTQAHIQDRLIYWVFLSQIRLVLLTFDLTGVVESTFLFIALNYKIRMDANYNGCKVGLGANATREGDLESWFMFWSRPRKTNDTIGFLFSCASPHALKIAEF